MFCLFIYYSCIPTKYYDVYSHPICCCCIYVSVLLEYIYSGRGALVAGRLEGDDKDLLPLLLFSDFM